MPYDRHSLGYREAGDDAPDRCGTCKHLRGIVLKDRLGVCGLFRKLHAENPGKWSLYADVGLHMRCDAFEAGDQQLEEDPLVQRARAFWQHRDKAEKFSEDEKTKKEQAKQEKFVEALVAAMRSMPAPHVDVHVPAVQLHADVHVPEQPRPEITVHVEAPAIPEPVIQVNLPAPVVSLDPPVVNVEAPIVNVEMPLRKTVDKIFRDSSGEMTEIHRTEEKVQAAE